MVVSPFQPPLDGDGGMDATKDDVEAGPPPIAETPAVLTQHYDNARTGANTHETVLTPKNVNKDTFGFLFQRAVSGHTYAQPLFVPKLEMPNKGTLDVVFVATENNDVYAFDANDPMANDPLWHVNLGTPVPSDDLTEDDQSIYRNIIPVLGISSTPVIDRKRGTIYLCGMAKENGERINRVYALSIFDGMHKSGSPLTLSIKGPGTGMGSVNGMLDIGQHHILQRPGLAMYQDTLLIAGGGHGDVTTPFHGWVNAYDADTLALRSTYITTPDGRWGGIWQGTNGLVVDDEGNSYFETGDGTFDATNDPPTLGDSFGKLSLGKNGLLSLVDWFTPYDQADLAAADADLGSTGPMLVPGTNLVIGGGKAGKLYVLDRNKMGHTQASNDDQIVQSFPATEGHEMYASPVYWEGPSGKRIYILGAEDVVRGIRFDGQKFATESFTKSTFSAPEGTPGGALALSANGTKDGIVWALVQTEGNAGGYYTARGALIAFDAEDLGKQLWSSVDAPKDDINWSEKFTIPTITGGKVFVPTSDDRLIVYGLR